MTERLIHQMTNNAKNYQNKQNDGMTGSFADNEPYGILQMYVCAPRLESGEGRHQAAPPSLLRLRDHLHRQ